MRTALVLLLVVSGCGETTPAAPGCGDSDGVCTPTAACDVPDPDCFTTFATDTTSATEAADAYLAADDPTSVRARVLVDRAWDLLAAARPLGDLSGERVAVLVTVDPTADELDVMPRDGKVPLALALPAGLFARPDDEILGEVLHELVHLVQLDPLPEVDHRVFSVIPGSAPLAAATTAGTAWIREAVLVGLVDDKEAGGAPFPGSPGMLGQLMLDAGAPSCPDVVASIGEMMFARDPVSGQFSDPDGIALLNLQGYGMQLSHCHAPLLRDVIAMLDPLSRAFFTASLQPAEQALLPQPATAALYTMITNHRTAERQIESQFVADAGVPWSSLRYHSGADTADEIAVRIGRAQGWAPTWLEDLGFARMRDSTTRTACRAAIASGSVPFGVDLVDPHHGACWRIAHSRQIPN